MGNRIELHEKPNRTCDTCSTEDRRNRTENYLCNTAVSVDDGLSVRCVGDWAYDKIFRLIKYFGIFAVGMGNSWKGRLNYIEICSGPGRCVLKETGKEIDGTALAVVSHEAFERLQSATFIDLEHSVIDSLNQRIAARGNQDKARAVVGDFTNTEQIQKILSTAPEGLNLVFIDPTECNVPFETIQTIKTSLKNVDFIINCAVGTDANRNLEKATTDPSFSKVRRKYEQFLGDDHFFETDEVVKWAKAGNNLELRTLFRECYKQRLKDIGLSHIDEKPVRHYYSLIFASANPRGLDFWRKSNAIEPDNQRRLPGLD